MVISWFFCEQVAQKLLYSVVYWYFSSTFFDLRAKCAKILHEPIYFSFLSSADRHRRTLKTCSTLSFLSHFWRRFPIFSSQNPFEYTVGFRGFRALGPFWAKMPENWPGIIKNTNEYVGFSPTHFQLFQKAYWKTYIIVYVFKYFWSKFSWFSCHTPTSCKCGATLATLFKVLSRLFSRPSKHLK